MIERGDFLMSWPTGHYGFINADYISKESLCINDLGLEIRNSESYYYNNLTRDYHGFLFQYTLDGYGIYETSGVKHKMTKGKAFFITFPEDSRYYFSADDDPANSWTFFYIHFSGPAAAPFFERIRELSGPVLQLEPDSKPINQFFDLYDILRSKSSLVRYMTNEWLYRFLISLVRYTEAPPGKQTSPYVAAAMNWMNQHYSEQINLEDMGKEIGISYSHLCRQFSKEQGITPMEYLTNIRLERGMQMLLNTDQTIEQIAAECGFSCANYFSKVYKKILNVTPSEYRKRHRP